MVAHRLTDVSPPVASNSYAAAAAAEAGSATVTCWAGLPGDCLCISFLAALIPVAAGPYKTTKLRL
jgi:hypothetical protein